MLGLPAQPTGLLRASGYMQWLGVSGNSPYILFGEFAAVSVWRDKEAISAHLTYAKEPIAIQLNRDANAFVRLRVLHQRVLVIRQFGGNLKLDIRRLWKLRPLRNFRVRELREAVDLAS